MFLLELLLLPRAILKMYFSKLEFFQINLLEIMNKSLHLRSSVNMKKSIIAIVFLLSLISVNSVLGLGLTAGTVRIVVDVGSSNSSRFGLLNSGNETVIVKLRAEGEAAQFLEF